MLSKLTHKKEKGFTLIELMIVIAIIGILAAIAIPQFSAYRQRSYNSAAQADLKNAATAQEAYFVDNSTYASAIGDLAGTTYGFYTTEKVTTSVLGATNEGYTMESYHSAGNKTYFLEGPGGSVAER